MRTVSHHVATHNRDHIPPVGLLATAGVASNTSAAIDIVGAAPRHSHSHSRQANDCSLDVEDSTEDGPDLGSSSTTTEEAAASAARGAENAGQASTTMKRSLGELAQIGMRRTFARKSTIHFDDIIRSWELPDTTAVRIDCPVRDVLVFSNQSRATIVPCSVGLRRQICCLCVAGLHCRKW